MAKRRTATQKEKEVIDRLAHAIVLDQIADNAVALESTQYTKNFKSLMRKECPQFFRLLNELNDAVPRVRKQMREKFEEGMNEGDK